MKTKQIGFIAILAVIATMAIIACKEDETPQKQPDTERTLSFGTDCKVTIKSDDKFTTDEWKTLCDKVVAAIEKGYNKTGLNSSQNNATFKTVFKYNIPVSLLKSATYDCEVKAFSHELSTVEWYIKISALDTIDLQPAIWAIGDGEAYHQP